MPEASVIRDPQVLSGFIGRKESVGGLKSFQLNTQGLTLGVLEKLLD